MILVHGIGSSESLQQSEACCDVCISQCPYVRLDILKAPKQKRKRKYEVHDVAPSHIDELKSRLVQERENILLEHPNYRMIGVDFVCPDAIISEVCKQSKYISSVEDMKIYRLRPEFRDRLLNVIMNVLSSIPPPKKKSRRRV